MTKFERTKPTLARVALSAALGAFFSMPLLADTVHLKGDTNINLATPAQVNGASTSLFVRNSGTGGDRQTFLEFDLSTLPPGVPISHASLRLWVSAVTDDGPVDVRPVLSSWDEATLSASISPPLDLPVGSLSVTATDQNRFVTVDVTTLVQGWMDGSIANFGIALVPTDADPVRITLDSKEATGTSHGPELEVTPIGPEGPAGPQGTPGSMGATGPPGPAGVDGAVGPLGPAGADGAPGPAGPAGPQGAQGLPGADGAVARWGPRGLRDLLGLRARAAFYGSIPSQFPALGRCPPEPAESLSSLLGRVGRVAVSFVVPVDREAVAVAAMHKSGLRVLFRRP